MTMELGAFVDKHTALVEPLERESALAYWDAARSGTDEDFKRFSDLKLKIENVYADGDAFDALKRIRNADAIEDGSLDRIADVLYLRFLGNQIDRSLLARIVELGAAVEGRFGTFRAMYEGGAITNNEVNRILREETDSEKRHAAWEALKQVGTVVVDDLLELVRLRNEAARAIGFGNYYTMSLTLSEQSEENLETVFDELERMTREPYREMKRELDAELARTYGLEADGIQPWHYHDPFFQEAPKTVEVDLDRYYAGRDVVGIALRFFESIGMQLGDVLDRSDLYERDGKNPHAFCTDIDRCGDIRILANIRNDTHWMETMLHELGHAAYDKFIDPSLPFLLRKYPHLCVTEASAMYFGRLARDPAWLRSSLGLPSAEVERIAPVIRKSRRCKQLIFARWCQTMFHFERALYADPDRDCNSLWWDLVERYQFVKRPEGRDMPDWAAKIHIVSNPVYYHNYMLGELIASQIANHICKHILPASAGGGIYGSTDVGSFFIDRFYRPGDTFPWIEHVERATGEPLTPRYFVEQFVKEHV